MPSKSTTRKAQRDMSQGKSPSTAAGEFVREEMEHVRKGRHGARGSRQAIAIGLSKARRAGVPVKKPAAGKRRGQTSKRGTAAAASKGRKSQSTRGKRASSTRRRRAG